MKCGRISRQSAHCLRGMKGVRLFQTILMKNLRCKMRILILATAVLCFATVFFASAQEISLEDALSVFYQSNFDVIVSKYEVDRAYADYVTAKLRPNPNLTVGYTNLAMSQWKTNRWDNTQLSVRIDQLIETAGKRTLRSSFAGETLEATKLIHRDVIRTLLIGFYTVYYNLYLDMLNLDFAKGEITRFDKLLKVGEKRFNAGFISLIDYTKLKIARIDLENSVTNLSTQLQNDMESFNFLLGSATKYTLKKYRIMDDFRSYRITDLLERAYENRFDYLSAQKQLKAADYALSLAKASRIPDVSVGGEWDSTGNPATNGIGFGFSVPLPLFNRYQGEIMKRTAEYRQIEVQIARVRGRIGTELNQALNTYTSGVTVFDSYKTRKGEMEGLLSNTEKAFSLGGITVLELLDTQKTYRDYITKYNQALTQAVLNKELLKVYTGEIK
jgi:outer membrane protein, heavy metal efflux system